MQQPFPVRAVQLDTFRVLRLAVQLAAADGSSLADLSHLQGGLKSTKRVCENTNQASVLQYGDAWQASPTFQLQRASKATASLSRQDSDEGSQEEGELADANAESAGANTSVDHATQDTSDSQGKQEAAEGASTGPAVTVKRKRGERAGKRVRQRQAKRAREQEENQSQFGSEQTPRAFKRGSGVKNSRPTCKYVLFSCAPLLYTFECAESIPEIGSLCGVYDHKHNAAFCSQCIAIVGHAVAARFDLDSRYTPEDTGSVLILSMWHKEQLFSVLQVFPVW